MSTSTGKGVGRESIWVRSFSPARADRGGERRDQFARGGCEVDGLELGVTLAGLDAGEVEEVVDQVT